MNFLKPFIQPNMIAAMLALCVACVLGSSAPQGAADSSGQRLCAATPEPIDPAGVDQLNGSLAVSQAMLRPQRFADPSLPDASSLANANAKRAYSNDQAGVESVVAPDVLVRWECSGSQAASELLGSASLIVLKIRLQV